MRFNKYLILALFVLPACTTTQLAEEPMTLGMGDAVAHNMNAQKVAPTPRQKADTYIPANAARRTLTRETYEAGETPELMGTGTTNGGQ